MIKLSNWVKTPGFWVKYKIPIEMGSHPVICIDVFDNHYWSVLFQGELSYLQKMWDNCIFDKNIKAKTKESEEFQKIIENNIDDFLDKIEKLLPFI